MVEISDLSRYLDSTAWLGVGVLGILVFLLGAYPPALSWAPGASYLELGIAFGGGALSLLGFSCYFDRREHDRRHPRRRPLKGRAAEIAIAPSFEVYRPPPRPAGRYEGFDEDGPPPP